MTREELKSILPHREPMLLVDDAVNGSDGTFVSHYTVRGEEFFLQGHFPGNPIVPGVILCEMMAQSAAVLFTEEMTEHTLFVYAGMNKVKFRRSVKPGETIEFRGALTNQKYPFFFFHGEAYVGDARCMEGDFSVACVAKE